MSKLNISKIPIKTTDASIQDDSQTINDLLVFENDDNDNNNDDVSKYTVEG